MTILTSIKADYMAARKAHMNDTVALLSTFIGDADMVGKNAGNRETTDQEVVALIKKYIKTIDGNLSIFQQGTTAHAMAVKEKDILSRYLPAQLTFAELSQIIATITQSVGNNKGMIMKELNMLYKGSFDGKMAADIIDTHK